ncbi:hypothetical protein [Myroides odoratus]|uniref:Uncharacterized protein n=1 Tax=Myroides odoratus TaxID=256 RepID=A0A378RLX2_MYROD|nr:hypothetical protein [Myroides odoratus]STZ27187.1 Uncharacterised protein [Myroides odoratus]
MRDQVLVYFLVLLAVFSLTHCTKKQFTTATDIDQLYAVQYDTSYKDSLANELSSSVTHALSLSNNAYNRSVIDSTLRLLRWTLDSVNF